MNLPDALHALATRFNLSTETLLTYAQQDDIGGYPDAFPTGIFGAEGQVLYALATYSICNTGYIAGGGGSHADDHLGKAIAAYHGRLLTSASIPLENLPDASLDLIFEDMSGERRRVWELARHKLAPGGFIISHDALHPAVGSGVLSDIRAAGFDDVLTVLIEPSDCGLAIWRDTGVKSEYVSRMETNLEIAKDITEVFAESITERVISTDWATTSPPDDLDTEVHETVDPETYSAPPAPEPKKRGRKPKARGQ